MRPLALVLPVALAACLSEPHGRPRDHLSWPPAGVDVRVSAARVVDLDHDGKDDLVVTSASPTAPAAYVLFGAAAGLGADYTTAVALPDPAVAVDVADLTGDGLGDLAVVSSPAAGRARLSVFPSITPETWDAAWEKTFAVETFDPDPPVNEPNPMVRVARVGAAGAWIVVNAKDGKVACAQLSTLDRAGFDGAALVGLPRDADLFYPSESFFVAHDGVQDLAVASYFDVASYAKVGDAALTKTTPAGFDPGVHASAFAICDVDRDGRPDVFGTGSFWSAVSLGKPASYLWRGSTVPGNVVREVCDDLDDQHDRIDVAVLTHADGVDGGRTITVVPDVEVDPADATGLRSTQAPVAVDLPGPTDVLVDGDFDGDGRRDLLAVARDGAIACFHVGPAGLARCW